jgi:hypothetical protein
MLTEKPSLSKKEKKTSPFLAGSYISLEEISQKDTKEQELSTALLAIIFKAKLLMLNKSGYESDDIYENLCEHLWKALCKWNKVIQRTDGKVSMPMCCEGDELDKAILTNCVVDAYDMVNVLYKKHSDYPCMRGPLEKIQGALACYRYEDGERAEVKYKEVTKKFNTLPLS